MLRRLIERFRRGDREEDLPVPSMLVVGLGNPGAKYAATRRPAISTSESADRVSGSSSQDSPCRAASAWTTRKPML